ncbi:Uncharacterized protein TCM_015279 [Theobroma cacao]|uniref:Uncharacterized protein n=1 Tax=Theobroma cacao TaxID=3641 RepID=A0A061G2C3_THECC|nr:Uncharacterized protein TCM_015279 [Theobroma cacao]
MLNKFKKIFELNYIKLLIYFDKSLNPLSPYNRIMCKLACKMNDTIRLNSSEAQCYCRSFLRAIAINLQCELSLRQRGYIVAILAKSV